ncbi:hypothetical protein BJ165DRAFT_1563190 [Panaeolus papilionaceus]|nr:hypothetical protein BJ165DRAFT_1563190 [Panaeolus papilionaceus]
MPKKQDLYKHRSSQWEPTRSARVLGVETRCRFTLASLEHHRGMGAYITSDNIEEPGSKEPSPNTETKATKPPPSKRRKNDTILVNPRRETTASKAPGPHLVSDEKKDTDKEVLLNLVKSLSTSLDKSNEVQKRQVDVLEALAAALDQGMNKISDHLMVLSEVTQDAAVLRAAQAGIPPNIFNNDKEYSRFLAKLATGVKEKMRDLAEVKAETADAGSLTLRRGPPRQAALERKEKEKAGVQDEKVKAKVKVEKEQHEEEQYHTLSASLSQVVQVRQGCESIYYRAVVMNPHMICYSLNFITVGIRDTVILDTMLSREVQVYYDVRTHATSKSYMSGTVSFAYPK